MIGEMINEMTVYDYLDIPNLIRKAYQYADENSPDPSTKVGAILITNHKLAFEPYILFGVNHLLEGYPKTPQDLTNRTRKYKLIEHAERDVIYKAARVSECTKGSILLCPWAACTDCARAICLSGIKLVIAHADALNQTPERWQEDLNIAKEMFESMGVKYLSWRGKIGNCRNLFNGQYWEP